MRIGAFVPSIAALLAGPAAAAGDALRFVACPIYRDTDAGKKSGCWLADDPATGTRHDVTSSPTKPDWNFAILVEGRPASAAGNPCGGILLDPVRVSVLHEPCTRFLLEGEGFAGRKFTLPRRNVRPLYEAHDAPAKPFAARAFVIPFDFGSSFVTYQLTDYYLDAALSYAIDIQPARVTITGYAATNGSRVSDRVLAEPPKLADERATLVARALALRGVPSDRIVIHAAGQDTIVDGEAFDTLPEASRRRVELYIEPLSPSKLPFDAGDHPPASSRKP